MHDYNDNKEIVEKAREYFWQSFLVVFLITACFIGFLFVYAEDISRTTITPKVHRAGDGVGGYQYREQYYVLKDGTQCIIIRGGSHSNIMGVSCNWRID
jgi:hypothetical protein